MWPGQSRSFPKKLQQHLHQPRRTNPKLVIDISSSQDSYRLTCYRRPSSRHLGRVTMDSSSRLLLNSTSSLWGDENACPSSLRARLRDDHTPATSSSTKPAPYQDVYQQVQACLGSHLLAPKPDNKTVQTSDTKDPAIQLRGKLSLQMWKNAQADIKQRRLLGWA